METTKMQVGGGACRVRPPGGHPLHLARRATENVRATEVAQATHTERRRIADELHDVLGLRLVALALTARQLADHPDPAVREPARRMDDLVHEAMTDVREVLGDLRAPAAGTPGAAPAGAGCDGVDAAGLFAARLAEIADSFPDDRVRVDVARTAAPAHVPRAVAHSAVRVVSESVTNAVKHGTGRVDVSVRLGATLAIEVSNEAGPGGCAPAVLDSGGDGLPSLRRRAAEHGAVLHAGRGADGRYGVRAVFDLSGTSAADRA